MSKTKKDKAREKFKQRTKRKLQQK
jgi:hypothetical protein